MHPKERYLDDYAREGLRKDVKFLVNEEMAKSRLWISSIIIFGFAICIILASWTMYVLNDVRETNAQRRELMRREAETDSLKREKFKEIQKKYDESLNAYYDKLRKN